MTPSQRRILCLAGAFGLVVAGLVAVLAWLMVYQHDRWLVRSHRNRWVFKDTPTRRGALLDRFGENVLAWDRPEFELFVYYLQFRRRHPVGAAVHGAELLRPAVGLRQSFDYDVDPARGPVAAFDLVARTRVGALLEPKSQLSDEVRRDLGFYGASLFAALSDQSMARVRARWRAALAEDPNVTLLEAMGTDRDLKAEFAAWWDELKGLSVALPADDPEDALLPRLRRWRLESERDRAAETRGEEVARFEERSLRSVVRGVPFELACGLEVSERGHPGLRLMPSVRRQRVEGASLRSVLGGVARLDRRDLWEPYMEDSSALDVERYRNLVPEELFDTEGFADELRSLARDHMRWTLQTTGRVGSSGLERALDAELAGTPGLRLVERDRDTRELMMARQLDIAPGEDVRLTLDLRLQQLAEQIVARTYDELRSGLVVTPREDGLTPNSERYLETAMAVIDGRTGEILSLAAWPPEVVDRVRDPDVPGGIRERLWPRQPAALMWRSAGDIGSLAKPLVFLQHLEVGPPNGLRSEREFQPCPGGRRIRVHPYRRRLSCLGAHGHRSKDGGEAVCVSCNVWFYEAAADLGDAGVRHGLERFGLVRPARAAVFGGGIAVAGKDAGAVPLRLPPHPPGTWLDTVIGLPGIAFQAPIHTEKRITPMKAIGYGTEASPVWVARAYAGLATGRLPALTLIHGERSEPVPLQVSPQNLHRVRAALRSVVERGTARRIAGLQRTGVFGKTGTAEVSIQNDNNAWFAGWLDTGREDDVLPVFAAVAYFVPDGTHGGDVAGNMVGKLLDAMAADPELAARYRVPKGAR